MKPLKPVVLGIGAVLLVGGLMASLGAIEYSKRDRTNVLTDQPEVLAPKPGRPVDPAEIRVFTYFFYWYDATTGQHLRQEDGLPTHPVVEPKPSWRRPEWFKKELSDMATAGIDVALMVYWGFDTGETWSTEGLNYLATARQQLTQSREAAPGIGMFFDTTILKNRDLTKQENIDYFYANVKDFYTRVPRSDWGLVEGRPVVWLFLPQYGSRVDQRLFDTVYSRFERDFAVRPYIVREVGWNCAINGWSGPTKPDYDCKQPIQTDASYVWGVAQNGYSDRGTVASVGPGYDERQVKGRAGNLRDRDGGIWYAKNFENAIYSRKKLLSIETWNEYHEASGIGETQEYGRAYIEATRSLISQYRTYLSANP